MHGGVNLRGQMVRYQSQSSKLLACFCSQSVNVAIPVQFLINANPWDIGSLGFSDGNDIECQGETVGFSR